MLAPLDDKLARNRTSAELLDRREAMENHSDGQRAVTWLIELLRRVDWRLVLTAGLALVLGLYLMWWAGYYMTFGRVEPDHPSDVTVIIAGLGSWALVLGAPLLGLRRLLGAVVVATGLMVAFAVLAARFSLEGTSSGRSVEALIAGLAFVGLILVARLGER